MSSNGNASQGPIRRERLDGHGVSRELHDYVQRINAAFPSAGQPIEAGRLLLEVKYKLGHGQWLKMFDEDGGRKLLRFGDRTAQRLMRIARNPILSNPTHVSKLPASWGTQYELTRFDDDLLQQMFDDDTIHPDLERKDVEEMLKNNEGSYNWPKLSRTLKVLMKYVQRWPDLDKRVDAHTKIDFNYETLPELAEWLGALHRKCQADSAARSALYERDREDWREQERRAEQGAAKWQEEMRAFEEEGRRQADEEEKADRKKRGYEERKAENERQKRKRANEE